MFTIELHIFKTVTQHPVTFCVISLRRVAEVEAGRAPQVLTIDHDESVGLSSSDDDEMSDEEVDACLDTFKPLARLSQSDCSLPGIASGQLATLLYVNFAQ